MIHTEILPAEIPRNIKVQDNGEQLVDLRTECQGLFFKIAEYLNDDTEIEDAYFVRESVAKMIVRARDLLPANILFLVRCGYRTPAIQQREFENDYRKLVEEFPAWTKSQLDIEIEKRTSSVDIAPHCTGGAVDISLVDAKGILLDMGTHMGEFVQKSYTYSKDVTDIVKANRQLLLSVMQEAGFINFPGEWWHFSYGTKEWAAYSNLDLAIYDNILERS